MNKFIFFILLLVLTACGDEKEKSLEFFEGDYIGGIGTIDNKNILFMFISEYPADQSIAVHYTTEEGNYSCRYYFLNYYPGSQERVYVAEPFDLAEFVIQKLNGVILAKFESTAGNETDPCKKIKSTVNFLLN